MPEWDGQLFTAAVLRAVGLSVALEPQRGSSLHIGVVFPHEAVGSDTDAIRLYVETIYDLGYDHLLAYDHVTGVDRSVHSSFVETARRGGAVSSAPYDVNSTFHEVMVLFGFIAGIAPIELVTGVLVLPQRATALVAKQAAEVDILSGGRLRLGVGIGWNSLEFRSLGAEFIGRGARIEQQIDLLRRYWVEPSVNVSSKHDWAQGMGLRPPPKQRPIPVWLGSGGNARALDRVGRLADGWIPMPAADLEIIGRQLRLVRDSACRAGRAPQSVGVQGRVVMAHGRVAQLLHEVDAWRSLGATHVALTTDAAGFGVGAHLAVLAEAADALQLRVHKKAIEHTGLMSGLAGEEHS
jgi:probable F420-dependent oxidoreductase